MQGNKNKINKLSHCGFYSFFYLLLIWGCIFLNSVAQAGFSSLSFLMGIAPWNIGLTGGVERIETNLPCGILFLAEKNSSRYRHEILPFCSSTLVANEEKKDEVLITAGHCLQDFIDRKGTFVLPKNEEIWVSFSHNLATRNRKNDIKVDGAFLLTPDFQKNPRAFLLSTAFGRGDINSTINQKSIFFDLAFLKLEKNVVGVNPAMAVPILEEDRKLPSERGVQVISSGKYRTFSITENNYVLNHGLRQSAKVGELKLDRFGYSLTGKFEAPSDEHYTGFISIENGDSGGFLGREYKSGHLALSGIITMGRFPGFSVVNKALRGEEKIGNTFLARAVDENFKGFYQEAVEFFNTKNRNYSSRTSKNPPDEIKNWSVEDVSYFQIPSFEKRDVTRLSELVERHHINDATFNISKITKTRFDISTKGEWYGQEFEFAFHTRFNAAAAVDEVIESYYKSEPFTVPDCLLKQEFIVRSASGGKNPQIIFESSNLFNNSASPCDPAPAATP